MTLPGDTCAIQNRILQRARHKSSQHRNSVDKMLSTVHAKTQTIKQETGKNNYVPIFWAWQPRLSYYDSQWSSRQKYDKQNSCVNLHQRQQYGITNHSNAWKTVQTVIRWKGGKTLIVRTYICCKRFFCQFITFGVNKIRLPPDYSRSKNILRCQPYST